MSTREIRFLRGKIEIRDVTAEQKAAGYIGVLEGFIPYESDSRELRDGKGHRFVERLARGVFTRSLADNSQTVFADVGHNDAATFARRGVNLDVTETDAGIKYTAMLPDTTTGRDLQTNVRLGIIDGTSFEFEVRDANGTRGDTWEKRDALNIRTIKDAVLHRVNPVTEPAYLETTLAARSCESFAATTETPPPPAETPLCTRLMEQRVRFL